MSAERLDPPLRRLAPPAPSYRGVGRVFPEMPRELAARADGYLHDLDLESALVVVKDWIMAERAERTRELLTLREQANVLRRALDVALDVEAER